MSEKNVKSIYRYASDIMPGRMSEYMLDGMKDRILLAYAIKIPR